MADMTIAVDAPLLRAAQVKAVQQGTRVNEVCHQAIEAFARGASDAQARFNRIKALARKARVTAEPLWPGREALYTDPGRCAPRSNPVRTSAFFDTDVLVVVFDRTESGKQARAQELVAADMTARNMVLSTQALKELCAALVARSSSAPPTRWK